MKLIVSKDRLLQLLLAAVQNCDGTEKCRTNPSLTRNQALNIYLGAVMETEEDTVHPIVARNICNEFGEFSIFLKET